MKGIFGKSSLILTLSGAMAVAAIGCADTEEPKISTAPVVQSIAQNQIMIGEVFEFEGRNFLPETEGRNFVRFEGEFLDTKGFSERVEVEVPVFFAEDAEPGALQKLQWARFGPFTNPFSSAGLTGRFEGKMVAVTESGEGVRVFGASSDAAFDVKPSIEFLELQPVGADCGMPALSGVAGVPYQITVRAIGFTPSEYEFQITSIQGAVDLRTPLTWTVPATGPTATLGADELDVIFQQVPSDLKYYIAGVLVRAKDAASGNFVEGVMPFDIHRPIEIEYNGNFQVAEYYEPEPVTACIPGSIGNRATYSETRTEMRQRSVSVRISQNWTQENGVSNQASWQEGYQEGEMVSSSSSNSTTNTRTEGSTLQRGQSYNESEANNFSHGTTNAETWNSGHTVGAELSVMVGAEGGASIPLVAEGKVKTSVTGTGKYSYNWGRGGSAAATNQWGTTTNRGTSNSINESHTLNNSNSNTRSFTDTTSRSSSRTYNFGGSATESERISQGLTEDEAQTWSESSANSTLTSYSGFIPVGKFGVFYRQTVRLSRVAQLVSYNACGERDMMGEIVLNEWKWAPDLAIGSTCDAQLPPANLPKAQCIIPPCE